jgi:S-adenosylmethionine:tRNA ribosyltransferase-isomerase
MRVDLFDFQLPEDRIALRPAEPRDSARLLVIPPQGPLLDRGVRDIPQFLRAGDVLVVNDTKVIPARLDGIRVRGEAVARIEATLHKREGDDRWRAFIRPAKKVNIGERIRFGEASESTACFLGALDAEVIEKGEGGEVLLAFSFAGPALDEAIIRHGHMPLPPYIASKRGEDARDEKDYQTLFAREIGAVAAPSQPAFYAGTCGVH